MHYVQCEKMLGASINFGNVLLCSESEGVAPHISRSTP